MQLAAVLAFVFSRNLWLNVASTCFSTRGWPIQFSDARRHLFTRDDAAKGAVLDSLIFAPQPGATQSFELTLLHSIGALVARVFEGLALQGACRRTAKARPMSQLCPNTSKYNVHAIWRHWYFIGGFCFKTFQLPQNRSKIAASWASFFSAVSSSAVA